MAAAEGIDLKAQWREVFHQDPPFRVRQDFLQRHIDWAMQAKKQGGLSRKAGVQLKQMMATLRKGDELKTDNALQIKSGTKLIRQYQGEKHEVIVTDSGFRYRDKTYNSLSSIARDITGTRWNGKVFFGVKTL